MKTVFENELIKISRTGRDYDFVGTIENKSDREIRIVFENEEIENFSIKPDDWVGIIADDEGYSVLEEIEAEQFTVE